jgi:hypothetical protein
MSIIYSQTCAHMHMHMYVFCKNYAYVYVCHIVMAIMLFW